MKLKTPTLNFTIASLQKNLTTIVTILSLQKKNLTKNLTILFLQKNKNFLVHQSVSYNYYMAGSSCMSTCSLGAIK